MSRINTALENDLKLVKLLRDEVGLQAHLLKAELKDRYGEMEKKWEELQAHLSRAGVAAGDARKDVDSAAHDLLESVRSGYTQIRNAMRS